MVEPPRKTRSGLRRRACWCRGPSIGRPRCLLPHRSEKQQQQQPRRRIGNATFIRLPDAASWRACPESSGAVNVRVQSRAGFAMVGCIDMRPHWRSTPQVTDSPCGSPCRLNAARSPESQPSISPGQDAPLYYRCRWRQPWMSSRVCPPSDRRIQSVLDTPSIFVRHGHAGLRAPDLSSYVYDIPCI